MKRLEKVVGYIKGNPDEVVTIVGAAIVVGAIVSTVIENRKYISDGIGIVLRRAKRLGHIQPGQ